MLHSRSRAITLILVFVASLALTEDASAQCRETPTLPPPIKRWSFTTLEWKYLSNGLPLDAVRAGAHAWNNQESFTFVMETPGGGFLDISFADGGPLPDGGSAIIDIKDYQQSGSECYLHPDAGFGCSSICYNTSRIHFADVVLDPNVIRNDASIWAPRWGVTFNEALFNMTAMVVSHEIGHFFWQGDVGGTIDCSRPTIMSANESAVCRLFGGPTECDGERVGLTYNGWDTFGSPCGGSCDLNTSCF